MKFYTSMKFFYRKYNYCLNPYNHVTQLCENSFYRKYKYLHD